jgi:myotubularin-related protein 1/2
LTYSFQRESNARQELEIKLKELNMSRNLNLETVINSNEFVQKLRKLDIAYTFEPPCLPGEMWILRSSSVIDIRGSSFFVGSLFLSNFRLAFCKYYSFLQSAEDEKAPPENAELLYDLPLHAIDKVDDDAESSQELVYLGAKDLRGALLSFKHATTRKKEFVEFIKEKAFTFSDHKRFAFEYSQEFTKDGWEMFDEDVEYDRLGLTPVNGFQKLSSNWHFQLTPSYPRTLIVPSELSMDIIRESSSFRSKRRFAVISWRDYRTGLFIARCSQPLTGLSRRSTGDEALISSMGKLTRKLIGKTSNEAAILICDARPKANAVGNAAVGGGWESEEYYQDTKFMFANIENIHVVRESFHGLRDLFNVKTSLAPPKNDDPESWADRYTDIVDALQENRNLGTWFGHLSRIMQGTNAIIDWISEKRGSVVVHCSDGWDRTAQLTSLAQLLMDPFYRTIEGFVVLVEKEWVGFGHKFAERCGHGKNSDPYDKQRSPIFLQWIDCVFQVLHQFPDHFQFNGKFLSDLIDEVYSCRFGTFLYDSLRDSVEARDRSKKDPDRTTISVWGMFVDNPRYLNPSFMRRHSHADQILRPSADLEKLALFLYFYKRWDNATMRFELEEDRILNFLILKQSRMMPSPRSESISDSKRDF